MVLKRPITFILSVLIWLNLWSGYAWLSAEPQLIARWPLDEGSGNVVQDVIGDNNGKRVGSPKSVPAKFENGLQFDKKTGQYVEIPGTDELVPNDSLT